MTETLKEKIGKLFADRIEHLQLREKSFLTKNCGVSTELHYVLEMLGWLRSDVLSALAGIARQPLDADAIRREVRDKLAVYASAERSSIPVHKTIVQKQCEDFLVELAAAGIARQHSFVCAEHGAFTNQATEATCPTCDANPIFNTDIDAGPYGLLGGAIQRCQCYKAAAGIASPSLQEQGEAHVHSFVRTSDHHGHCATCPMLWDYWKGWLPPPSAKG